MKLKTQLASLALLILTTVSTLKLSAQATKADIFDTSKPITWLGIDFSQTKIIGTANQWGDKGAITNAELRDTYTVAWNELFINEQKKYDVAKAVHRATVKYDIDIALKANQASLAQKDFFTNSPNDFKTLTEASIAALVKNYDFKNDDGIGLIFFVEGMSKGTDSMGVWVTFVDIKTKTVLLTDYQTEKPGGFGFRNYWAKPFYSILKNMDSNFKKMDK